MRDVLIIAKERSWLDVRVYCHRYKRERNSKNS